MSLHNRDKVFFCVSFTVSFGYKDPGQGQNGRVCLSVCGCVCVCSTKVLVFSCRFVICAKKGRRMWQEEGRCFGGVTVTRKVCKYLNGLSKWVSRWVSEWVSEQKTLLRDDVTQWYFIRGRKTKRREEESEGGGIKTPLEAPLAPDPDCPSWLSSAPQTGSPNERPLCLRQQLQRRAIDWLFKLLWLI